MSNLTTYHNNTVVGLTIWNSDEQCYYLVSLANVTDLFKKISVDIEVPLSLVDKAFEFMSEYSPEEEIVLLTLNEDLLTVSIVSKNLKPSREAAASMLGWSLDKVATINYLMSVDNQMDAICSAMKISYEEYDKAMEIML